MAKLEASVWTSNGMVWSKRTRTVSSEIAFFKSSNACWHFQINTMFGSSLLGRSRVPLLPNSL